MGCVFISLMEKLNMREFFFFEKSKTSWWRRAVTEAKSASCLPVLYTQISTIVFGGIKRHSTLAMLQW